MSSPYFVLYSGIFLLATNGLFAKGIALDAISITQLRSVIAMLAIMVFIVFFVRGVLITNKKKLFGIYGLGILMGLHWATFFHSMQVSTIAIGMISLYTFPVMVVFLESAIHRHWPLWKDIFAATIVLVGIVVMTIDQISVDQPSALVGISWGVISAFLFALRNIVQKYYFPDVSSEQLMLHQVIAIALMLLPFMDYTSVVLLPHLEWVKLIVLGIVTTAGAHTLLVQSYKNLPAKTVAMISCLQPVFGAILAWLFLDEQPGIYIILGGALVLAVAINESLQSGRQR